MSRRPSSPPRPGLGRRWLGPAAAWGAIAAAGVMVAACGSGQPVAETPGPRWSQEGWASWYGHPFHGRQTASGAVYDMHLLTAAHRTLTFGTRLEVENLDNGRRVVVEVNDRGPFVKGRIIDLSYGAARELGMVNSGLARVRLTAVSGPPAGRSGYTVQVAAFRDQRYAAELVTSLDGRYPAARIERSGEWYRVRVGAFEKEGEARKLQSRLRRDGHEAAIVVEY